MNFVSLQKKHEEKFGKREMVALTGSTFFIRGSIKEAGGEWYAHRKTWLVPKEHAERLQAMIDLADEMDKAGV